MKTFKVIMTVTFTDEFINSEEFAEMKEGIKNGTTAKELSEDPEVVSMDIAIEEVI